MSSSREWIHKAQCATPHADPQWWDCDGHVLSIDNKLAISLCEACPVKYECEAETLATPDRYQGTIRHGVVVPTLAALRKRRAARAENKRD